MLKNEKRKVAAVRLFREGSTINDIAHRLKAKEQTIRSWLKPLPEYKAQSHKKRTPKIVLVEQRKQVIKMFGEGNTNKAAISRATGASKANVHHWIKQTFPVVDANAERKKVALELHLSGRYTGTQIAYLINERPQTVQKWIREKRGSCSIKKDLIKRLYAGFPFEVDEITALLGCTRTTVLRYIKE